VRTVAVAIAFGADELHSEPVIIFCGWRGGTVVVKKLRIFAIVADEKILPAVVVVVTDGEAAAKRPVSKCTGRTEPPLQNR
jgi:hypothetical protein